MIRVYGASDDLIEIEGALTEEFSGDNLVLGFSNGVLLRVKYDDDGMWSIRVLEKPVGQSLHITYVSERSDVAYSDVALINGDIEWVVAGLEYVR